MQNITFLYFSYFLGFIFICVYCLTEIWRWSSHNLYLDLGCLNLPRILKSSTSYYFCVISCYPITMTTISSTESSCSSPVEDSKPAIMSTSSDKLQPSPSRFSVSKKSKKYIHINYLYYFYMLIIQDAKIFKYLFLSY